MKTKRAIAINDSLVHGICNCSCITCGINKDTYQGPKEYQDETITRKLCERVVEAAEQNVRVRYIAISGDGEPTLHPQFARQMDILGEMRTDWSIRRFPPPEIAVVTNGLLLQARDIFPSLVRNKISLKISFPSSNPAHYGEIMIMDAGKGVSLLQQLTPGIEEAMRLFAGGQLRDLEFHIAPPYREYVSDDFPETLNHLARLAGKNGMKTLKLLMFPATSNRTGSVRLGEKRIDKYSRYFRRYHGKRIAGVRVEMALSTVRFFPKLSNIMELLNTFAYPCIWYGNIFLSPAGGSYCSNDQNLRDPVGDIVTNTLEQIMAMKENRGVASICRGCNQAPEKLRGGLLFWLFRIAAKRHLKSRAKTGGSLPGAS